MKIITLAQPQLLFSCRSILRGNGGGRVGGREGRCLRCAVGEAMRTGGNALFVVLALLVALGQVVEDRETKEEDHGNDQTRKNQRHD